MFKDAAGHHHHVISNEVAWESNQTMLDVRMVIDLDKEYKRNPERKVLGYRDFVKAVKHSSHTQAWGEAHGVTKLCHLLRRRRGADAAEHEIQPHATGGCRQRPQRLAGPRVDGPKYQHACGHQVGAAATVPLVIFLDEKSKIEVHRRMTEEMARAENGRQWATSSLAQWLALQLGLGVALEQLGCNGRVLVQVFLGCLKVAF